MKHQNPTTKINTLTTTCSCGSVSHGILQFQIETWKDPILSKLMGETYVQMWALPYQNSVWKRIVNTWNVLMCRPVDVCFYLNNKDTNDLGHFLVNNSFPFDVEIFDEATKL